MAFPKADRQYALIMDAATGTAYTLGRLRAILTQVGQRRKFLHNLLCITKTKWSREELLTFLTGSCSRSLGHGLLQQAPLGQAIHLIHRSQALGEARSPALNRLQTAVQLYFVIHFKKGSNMPADYFSRLPGAKEAVASIAAINPFQADLFHLHMQDEHIQMLQTYMTMNEWPTNLSRQDQTYFKNLAEKEKTRQEKGGLDQTHRFQLSPDCSVSSGMMQKRSHVWGSWQCFRDHNATHKTYLKKITSYYWPKLIQDIEKHKNVCLRCQKIYKQKDNVSAAVDSGSRKPPSSCRFLWPHDHSRQ